jgi:hypothetical protein
MDEERGIAVEPMKRSLLAAAQTLQDSAGASRETQLAALRDAAIAIEHHLDLFAAESRPGGSQTLKARVLPQAGPLQGRLREVLVSAWEAEKSITADGANGQAVSAVAGSVRKAADDALRLLHESVSYEDKD